MGQSRADKALIEERRARALRLRASGHRLDEIIALVEGYSSIAHLSGDIGRALKIRADERRAAADEYIELEIAKLDEQEFHAWKVLRAKHYVVNQGRVVYLAAPNEIELGTLAEAAQTISARELPLVDDAPVLEAIAILLKIAERRAKLLGLDAPVKKVIEVQTGEGLDDKINSLILGLKGPAAG